MANSGTGPGRLDNPKNRTRLETQVHLFKTPTANLGSNGGAQPPSKRKAGGHGPTLDDEVSFMSGQWLSEDGKDYGPAVAAWAGILGRPAPDPVEPGSKTERRLSRHFNEWLMGLPEGWVTGVPGLSRSDMMTVLGGGVVPQQGEAAFRYLMSDLGETMADQPDIQVTDGAASPLHHVTVSVDGHETIVHQDDATQFVRDAYEQNQ